MVEEEDGGRAAECRGGRGSEVEPVVVWSVVSRFPVDPPPLCEGLCFTTFSSSIWVSAVPWARPKSTSAYLDTHLWRKSMNAVVVTI